MRGRLSIHALAALGGIALIGCGNDAGPPESGELDVQPVLVTDRVQYAAVPTGPEGPYRQFSFTLEARFTNESRHPLYLARCTTTDSSPIFGVIPGSPEGPETAYSPNWGCAGHDKPLVVPPGATRLDRILIQGPTAWASGGIHPLGVLTGQFRLVYGASACRQEGPCPVGPVRATSNEFDVSLSE